jgi:hypothetical protein
VAVDDEEAVGSRPPVAALAALRTVATPLRVSHVWKPFLASRLLVWTVGILAAWLRHHQGPPDDPTGLTAALGHTGNIIAAPAVRWDAIWYLTIAQHGYQHSTALPDFFPLYPLLIRALSWSALSAVVAGVLISLVAFWIGLELVYRLAERDFGARAAMATVWLLALFPMSFFFSAVYTEALFLALSTGCLYLARCERWLWAGILGGLASATRSIGILLVVPLAVLYVQQLRASRGEPSRGPAWRTAISGWGSGTSSLRSTTSGWWPAIATKWSGLVGIALIPLGLAAYVIGMAIADGTPLAMFNAQQADRGFVVPPVTIIRQFTWTVHHIARSNNTGQFGLGLLNTGVMELGFLALAGVCAVGMVRRLNPAHVAYVVVGLLVLLSEPAIRQSPLTSFPRYIMVLFPLWVWLALALHRHRRIWIGVLGLSTLALALFTLDFATWYFVA